MQRNVVDEACNLGIGVKIIIRVVASGLWSSLYKDRILCGKTCHTRLADRISAMSPRHDGQAGHLDP